LKKEYLLWLLLVLAPTPTLAREEGAIYISILYETRVSSCDTVRSPCTFEDPKISHSSDEDSEEGQIKPHMSTSISQECRLVEVFENTYVEVPTTFLWEGYNIFMKNFQH
jgi:hypothetical protein